MTNFKKILVAGAVALGVTGLAQINASADEVTVKAGDTVSGLADANDTTVESIETLNPEINKETHLIYVGDVLKVNDDDQAQKDEVQAGVGYYYYDEPQAPAVQAPTPVAQPEPVVQEVKATTAPAAPVDNSSAKEWIANKESGGSYTAANPSGAYGKYQLMSFNLKYGTSPEGQERAADEYVANRYSTWDEAKSFWQSHGWY